MNPSFAAIRDAITRATGRSPDGTPEPVGGGCIHRAFVLGDFFVKLNEPSFLGMFETEADGLRALDETGTIRVPEPLATGADDATAFLVLERLDLGGRGDEAQLGEQLAALHRHTGSTHGWDRDNFIGSTPQSNSRCAEWPVFFRDQRIGPMLGLLAARGTPIPGGELLLGRIPDLLAGVSAPPALLHGDLWAGNAGFLGDGTPVLFDPAVYFGHRETDLAMTRLFGGFGRRFYEAYHSVFPPDPGSEIRCELYKLYHVLNHALLFGGGYASQAGAMVRRLGSGPNGV